MMAKGLTYESHGVVYHALLELISVGESSLTFQRGYKLLASTGKFWFLNTAVSGGVRTQPYSCMKGFGCMIQGGIEMLEYLMEAQTEVFLTVIEDSEAPDLTSLLDACSVSMYHGGKN